MRHLINFILDHGFRAYESDGIIYGEMVWSDGHTEWEVVGTTATDCRNWLGY